MESVRKRYICVAFVICLLLVMQVPAGAGLVMAAPETTDAISALQIFSITTLNILLVQDIFNRNDRSSEQCSALSFAANSFRQVDEYSLLSRQTDIYLDINSVATAPRFKLELPSDVVSPDLITAAN